jgi:hypothetical protein
MAAMLAVALAPAVAAGATVYHPDREAREFTGSAGGWTGTTVNSNPACAEGITCPEIDEEWAASDGVDGADDGFIRVRVTSIASLLTTTVSTLTGPPFTYGGDAGAQPRTVTLALDSRADDGQLLSALAGGGFTVFLDDLTSGESLEAVVAQHGDQANGWTAVPAASLDRRRLEIGHDYRVRIVNTLELSLSLVPGGSFDFDNVVLRAGGAGGGGATPKQLRAGVRSATLRGRRLAVRLRCPGAATAKCRYSLVARAGRARSARVSDRVRAGVAPGRARTAVARVKRRRVSVLERRGAVTLTGHARSGETRIDLHRRVRLGSR